MVPPRFIDENGDMWGFVRCALIISIGFGSSFAFAASDVDPACIEKCKTDPRNEKYLDEGYGGQIHFCEASCRISKNKAGVYEDLNTYKGGERAQEWNPEHPVVRRCFQEVGFSDRFLDVSNQAANNCIMNGLTGTQPRQQDVDKSREVTLPDSTPIPTPRPTDTAQQQAAAPTASTPASDISRLNSVCQAGYEEVRRSCDQGRHAELERLANQEAQATQGTADACGQIQQQSTNLNAALSDFQRGCDAAVNNCVSSCDQAIQSAVATTAGPPAAGQSREQSFNSQATGFKELCSGMRVKVSMVQQQTRSSLQTTLEAAGCAAATAASATGDTPTQEPANLDCAKTPEHPHCRKQASDCSNPQIAASDPVCICSKNPAACGSPQNASIAMASLPSNGNPLANPNGEQGLPGEKNQDPRYSGVYMNPDGSGPSGGISDSGSGFNPDGTPRRPSDAEAQAVAANSADVLAGQRGRGMAGRLAQPRPGPGSNGYDGQANGTKMRPSDHLDMNAFRPGMHRRMAGMGYRDGITGPHTDIWKKVKDRYHAVQESLQP